jgi:putative addiction module component (TIGR02574 family)
MPSKQAVIEEALKLPEGERLEVVEALYESLTGPADADAEQGWSEEIKRRVEDLAAGRVRGIPWVEARRRIAGEDDGEAAA